MQEEAGSAQTPRDEKELTSIAYSTVEGLDFPEPNDGVRLGYHVYRYVIGELPTLEAAIRESKSRTSMHPKELERIIAERLQAAGVPIR